MLSATVSSGTSWPNWNTNPNAVRRNSVRLVSLSVSSRRPSNHTSPLSGGKMPARQCSSVDLPEPLGPMTARISPLVADRLAPASAAVCPNDRCTSRASITQRRASAAGGTAQHQRQHDLGEQDGLQVRLRLNRLPEPRLVDAEVGDRIPLAVRPGARLGIPGYNLAIAREAAERGVDLAERQRPAPAEVGVIVALEVISVARLSLEQAKEG